MILWFRKLRLHPVGDKHRTRGDVPSADYDLEYRLEVYEPLRDHDWNRMFWAAVAVGLYWIGQLVFLFPLPWIAATLGVGVVTLLTLRLGERIAHEYALFATANPRAKNRLEWRRRFEPQGVLLHVLIAVLSPLGALLFVMACWPARYPVCGPLHAVLVLLAALLIATLFQLALHPGSVRAFWDALGHYLTYGVDGAPPWSFQGPYGAKCERCWAFWLTFANFWGVVQHAALLFPVAALYLTHPLLAAKHTEDQPFGVIMTVFARCWMEGWAGCPDFLLCVLAVLVLPPLAFFALLYASTAGRVAAYYHAFEAPGATEIDYSITPAVGYQNRLRETNCSHLKDTIILGVESWLCPSRKN